MSAFRILAAIWLLPLSWFRFNLTKIKITSKRKKEKEKRKKLTTMTESFFLEISTFYFSKCKGSIFCLIKVLPGTWNFLPLLRLIHEVLEAPIGDFGQSPRCQGWAGASKGQQKSGPSYPAQGQMCRERLHILLVFLADPLNKKSYDFNTKSRLRYQFPFLVWIYNNRLS